MQDLKSTLYHACLRSIEATHQLVDGRENDTARSLECLRDELSEYLRTRNEPIEVGPVDSVYASECPPGYDTILGYISKQNPETLDLLKDLFYDTRADAWRLRHMCQRDGLQIHSVEAPEIAHEDGQTSLPAFPVELLRRKYSS